MSTCALLARRSLPDMIQPMVDLYKEKRGERIADTIENSGKSQRQVADEIGITPQSITKWMKTGLISLDHAAALAEVTGGDLRYLASGKHGLKIAEPHTEYQIKHADIHQLLEKLDSNQARLLRLCADALLDAQTSELEVHISIGDKKLF